jgi:hypothetical protein
MINKIALVIILLVVFSCDLPLFNINGEKVSVDPNTHIYTFKDNGKPVTGMVIFYEVDSKTGKEYKKRWREIKDGKRINKGFEYYPSGSVESTYSFDKDGLLSGTTFNYFENGSLSFTAECIKNVRQGITKVYDEKGIQTKELIFDNDKVLKEYDFDNNGNKIIPSIEKLELLDVKSGFYESINMNVNQRLYLPIVILKFKNISNDPLTEYIEIEGLFIDNSKSEEFSNTSTYFQGTTGPLQPGLSRQCLLKSSVGYTSPFGTYNSDISCKILINKQLFRTIKIGAEILESNRMQ